MPKRATSRTAGTPASERALRTQGKQTLGRLLDAGLQVLTERGYHAARVDDVVRVANLSHGTFYLYFTNKEDLFRALAQECAQDIETLTDSLGPVTPDKRGEAELRRWLTQFLVTYRRYGAVIRAWMQDPIVDADVVQLGFEAFAQIVDTLRRRVADADSSQLVDQEVATAAMIAVTERVAYFTSSRDLAISDEHLVDTLTTFLHRGLFGAPVRRRATKRRAPASAS